MFLLRALHGMGRRAWHVVQLSQDDLDGTYPDRHRISGMTRFGTRRSTRTRSRARSVLAAPDTGCACQWVARIAG